MSVGRVILLITLVLLSGCQSAQPDLRWLYHEAVEKGQPPPVIIIPGIMGSRLIHEKTGEEVWPGSWLKLVFSQHQSLALSINDQTLAAETDDLTAGDLFDGAAGRDFYGRILRTLEQAAGYRKGTAGKAISHNQAHYYVMTYDWRQDNLHAVRQLDRLITQIRQDYNNPDLKVDIIAHSMGGLITRYFLRYGTQDVMNDNQFPVTGYGAQRVRRVALLGTPNLGSVTAIRSFIEGRRIGLRKIPAHVMMTMPAIYQLFPHALTSWLITSEGKPLKRDQFDSEIWQRFQVGPWNPEVLNAWQQSSHPLGTAQPDLLYRYFHHHLERVRRFTWSLTVNAEPVQGVEIRQFGGDCHPTPARILVEEIKGESHLRLWPSDIHNKQPDLDYQELMLEPGDGAVTKSSLLSRNVLNPGVQRHRFINFPARQAFFLCENHENLSTNIHFQDNLLHFLLSR